MPGAAISRTHSNAMKGFNRFMAINYLEVINDTYGRLVPALHLERQRYGIEKKSYRYVRSVRFWNSGVRKWSVSRPSANDSYA